MHNMHKIIISLICCLLPAFALAEAPEVRDNAPDRHIVVKGDTLWGISAQFFKDPWKWPQIWGMNKDTIRDPHWIYPGDVILLDRATGTLRVGEEGARSPSASSSGTVTVKLSPKARREDSEHGSIPNIPIADIAPFLSQPLVIEANGLSGAPTLTGTYEHHVILGSDDIAYARGLTESKGIHWQVFRPGKTFTDPDSKAVLGYEAIYLGDADVEKFGDISTVRITRAVQEINPGDRLIQPPGIITSNYVPHAPEKPIAASVISVYGGVSQAGQNTVITLNKGTRDGLENGHVLALYRKGETMTEKGKGYFAKDVNYDLPNTRYGLLFVFRTFDKVSYALVLQTSLPVELLDRAQTP